MIQAYRAKYPPNWEQLARQCKERAAWRCEHCGAEQYSIAISKHNTPYMIYLHAAHKYHDKENPTPDLIALCVACHARHDWRYKQSQARVHLERLKHLKRLIDTGIVTIEALYR